MFKPYKGANVKGKTDDGKMIACDSSNCKLGQ